MDPVSRAQSENTQESRLARFGDKRKIWPKGVSGNPGGRPKRKFTTKVYAELFRDKEFREEFKRSVRKIMTAGKGMAPVLMAREVAERLEGPVIQNLNISGELTLSVAETITAARKRASLEIVDAA